MCRHTMWNADVACLFASMPVCADCLDKARIWERIGLSIQRAARRAEVAGLVETIRLGAVNMAEWGHACGAGMPTPPDKSPQFRAALSRLARLAGGEA